MRTTSEPSVSAIICVKLTACLSFIRVITTPAKALACKAAQHKRMSTNCIVLCM